MKKLMVLATVALTAIATQAASITWGARNIYIPVAADVNVSQTGIIASSGTKFAADALTVALYWVAADGTKTAIDSYATTGAGLIGGKTLGDSSADTALYTAMLAQGDSYKPNYYFTATYTTADGTYVYPEIRLAVTMPPRVRHGDRADRRQQVGMDSPNFSAIRRCPLFISV